MAEDDFEGEAPSSENDFLAHTPTQAAGGVPPPNSMLGSDGQYHLISPNQPRRYTAGKDAIPPNAEPWEILHRDKSIDFVFNGKRRAVRHGSVKPFESEEEAVAFVRFISAHPEFKFIIARYQDDTKIIYDESAHLFTLTTSGKTVPVTTLTRDWKHLRSGGLWIVQKEYGALPIEHRSWLYRAVAAPASADGAPRYWAGGHNWSDGSRLKEFLDTDSWWHGYTDDNFSADARRVREAFAQIKIGDGFAIKGYGGRSVIKLYLAGTVVGKDEAKRLVKIRPAPLPKQRSVHPAKGTGSWFGTLREVKDPAIINWMFHQTDYVPAQDSTPTKIAPMTIAPLNQILYGPPGTGKTFATAALAVQTIDDDAPDERAELMGRYNEMQTAGQIAFVTFHQSYAYEDFIEGIRPVMDDASENGIPRYECKPGILKEIADRATFDMLVRIPTAPGVPEEISFDTLWNLFLEKIQDDPLREYEGLSKESRYTITVSERGNLRGSNVASPDITSTYNSSRKTMAEIYAKFPDNDLVRATDIRQKLGRGSHDQFNAVIFRELKALKASMPPTVPTSVVVETLTEDEQQEIVQRYRKLGADSGYQIKPASEWNRYVLIIDEINRGNISKILGELITLLEDDKRFGNDNALVVTLPYSRERFALPANLHIIGTMNTADKSIALVDIALRRRFDFEELVPDFAVCEGLTQPMRDVLTKLNERITLRKDRDHRIGHAFFVHVHSEEAFDAVWKRKIAPLLLEYFYGDWDGLRYVLGESGPMSAGLVRPLEGIDRDSRNRFQWHGDTDTPVVGALELLAANYKIGLNG